MCGINGVFAKTDKGKLFFNFINSANDALSKRGPDASGVYTNEKVALGHRRLSIIDLSTAANQPMWDSSGKYAIVFNGEIFNYIELKSKLQANGVQFNTNSDTEVLLELYKEDKTDFLNQLNGFFAFAIYDSIQERLFLARDRYGIKPLWYYEDQDVFVFSSELKGLLQFPVSRNMNQAALFNYLHFNYVPPDESILKDINKHKPGTYKIVSAQQSINKPYYEIPRQINQGLKYNDAQSKLEILLDEAVKKRLISDVPVGAFLSGGIDSSIIVALAARHTSKLSTFSVGYKDNPFYDETHYAELVAEKFKTNHTVFKLTQDDLLNELDEVLDYLDEPFADSSALPVFVLSKYTRKKVTVALSGDGADELFGGYMKHWAEYKVRHPQLAETLAVAMSPLSNLLPQSRGSYFTNKIRQWQRFANGFKMDPKERYIRWCSIGDSKYVSELLTQDFQHNHNDIIKYANAITGSKDLNDCFASDMNLVLSGDMLVKVDMMSMANSLEVRVPFLDYTVVNFAFSMHSDFKVDRRFRKKIVQDAFRNILPHQLYNRPKKGFEVPLLEWMRGKLNNDLRNKWLNKELIHTQNIFNYNVIESLLKQLESQSPGDAPAKLWGIIQFQNFWMKYLHNFKTY